MYHVFFIRSSVDGRSGCFHIFTIMNSAASDSEKLAKLIELVGNIDMKMDILIEKVTDMSVNIAELKDAFGQNVDKILAELVKSNSNFDVLIALQAENNKAVVKTAQNTDEIIAKLNMMGDKMFSLAELEAMLGPLFDEVADKITGDMISADELSAILEAHKTDLTKTNGLIENLTDVVKNLKLNGSNGISSEQMQALTDAIEAFRRQEGANDEAQMEAYQKIMDEIASLKGGIDAIANSLATANAKFTAFTEKADMYGSEMLAYMEKLRNGQADAIATIEAYAQKANDAAVQAQQARNEQIALLQALVNKEVGGNGGGLTKEELEEVLAGLGLNPKDYSTVLEEIRDAIGNVITSDDLQNFYLKTQPDLTKTNALIETLIDVLKNKKFSVTGDVNVNMLEVENLLGKIYDLQANGQSPNSSQIDELTRLVQQLVELVNGNDAEKAAIYRALSNNPQALGMFAFYDAVNALNSKVAVDKYTV